MGVLSSPVKESTQVGSCGIVLARVFDHGLDLWWALRGAGPAFGVVTRYKARAFPVPVVFAGSLI